jgi:hypothetical protein
MRAFLPSQSTNSSIGWEDTILPLWEDPSRA